MSVVLLIIYLMLSYFCIWRIGARHIDGVRPLRLLFLFTIKLFYAYFFLFVYTAYYGGGELTADAGRFFKESIILNDVFYQSPRDFLHFIAGWQEDPQLIKHYLSATSHWNAGNQFLPNDSRNVIRVNALLYFISNGSVYIHFLFFSFVSFLASVDFFQFLRKHSKIKAKWLVVFVTIAPSIAFWSSSIIKEPLMIVGLFLLLRGVLDTINWKRKTWRIVLGGLFLIGFKPYVSIVLIVALLFYLIWSRFSRWQLVNVVTFVLFGFIVLYATGGLQKMTTVISKQQEDFMNVRDGGLYLDAGNDQYYYVYFNNRKAFDFNGRKAVLQRPVGAFLMDIDDNFNREPIYLDAVGDTFHVAVSMDQAGSGIEVTTIQGSFPTMLKMIPEVLFNTLVRPLPKSSKTWLQYPAFIENCCYLLFLLLALGPARRLANSKEARLVWTMGIFAFFILLIVGWTTPVVGAIVRYVIPAQVGLLAIILIMIDPQQLKNHINRITRRS